MMELMEERLKLAALLKKSILRLKLRVSLIAYSSLCVKMLNKQSSASPVGVGVRLCLLTLLQVNILIR
ncbi:hypothetical protein NSQ29_20070 [Paenibacillus sp. FSL F4-0236]|uniref:hypothetical protein n=1 Tax=Paenibacillus sp. FSL F4-0236 TaxID=2954731 RepID=UPI0030FA4229